jgi:hypothetical protein
MNILEIFTLLLVAFVALSYIDNHNTSGLLALQAALLSILWKMKTGHA